MKKKVKNEIRKKEVNDAGDPSRFTKSRCFGSTSHISHPLVTFFISHSFIHILCIVFLIIVIYSNTLNAPFQWDEGLYLVDNPIVKDLHYFTNPSDAKGFALYNHFMERYIGYLTFAFNYNMHGFSVTGYHIVNITIHIANAILVYLLVLLTFKTPFFKNVNGEWVNGEWIKAGESEVDSRLTIHDSRSLNDSPFTIHHSRPLIAFFSAAIFAVHPLQTEAVTYVFQRFVPLAAFFSLLSLTAYVRSRLAEDKKQRLFFYCIAFISAVLAMKTKEIAFTLPIMIVLYEFCFFSRFTNSRCFGSTSHVSRFLYIVPLLLTMSIIPLTLMYLNGTMSTGKHHFLPGLPGVSYAGLSRGEYMLTQFRVIVTYLRLLFLPVNQNFDYDYPVFKSVLDPQVFLSFVFIAALFGLAVYFIRSSRFTKSRCFGSTIHDSRPFRLMGFGILWFFITLSVESSIVPLDRLIDEYRVYLPSAGLIICAVTGLFLFFSRFTFHVSHSSSRFTVVLLVLIIAALSVATYQRNEVWGDTIRLWGDTAKQSPAKAIVHFNLGNAYRDHGVFNKAVEQYLTAIKLKPDFSEAYNNLGFVYQTFNMPEKAMEDYLIAIKLDPDDANAHFHLGFLYYKMGQMENSRSELMIGLKIKPDDQRAQQLLRNVN